jgi:hypothetical protein
LRPRIATIGDDRRDIRAKALPDVREPRRAGLIFGRHHGKRPAIAWFSSPPFSITSAETASKGETQGDIGALAHLLPMEAGGA